MAAKSFSKHKALGLWEHHLGSAGTSCWPCQSASANVHSNVVAGCLFICGAEVRILQVCTAIAGIGLTNWSFLMPVLIFATNAHEAEIPCLSACGAKNVKYRGEYIGGFAWLHLVRRATKTVRCRESEGATSSVHATKPISMDAPPTHQHCYRA
jgi:hypothetical protein